MVACCWPCPLRRLISNINWHADRDNIGFYSNCNCTAGSELGMVPKTEGHVACSRWRWGWTNWTANIAGAVGENTSTCGKSFAAVNRTERSGMLSNLWHLWHLLAVLSSCCPQLKLKKYVVGVNPGYFTFSFNYFMLPLVYFLNFCCFVYLFIYIILVCFN